MDSWPCPFGTEESLQWNSVLIFYLLAECGPMMVYDVLACNTSGIKLKIYPQYFRYCKWTKKSTIAPCLVFKPELAGKPSASWVLRVLCCFRDLVEKGENEVRVSDSYETLVLAVSAWLSDISECYSLHRRTLHFSFWSKPSTLKSLTGLWNCLAVFQ